MSKELRKEGGEEGRREGKWEGGREDRGEGRREGGKEGASEGRREVKGGFGIRQGGSEYAVVYRRVDRYAKNNRDVD